jgi:glycerophosphoryl diester phosphodiesterase
VGADVLELDVQATRDDHLVVSHDPHIEPHLCQPTAKTKRQPNAAAKNQPTAVSRKQTKIPIRTLTLAAVRRYDCGSRVNPRFPTQKPVPGAKIPTLKEVLALLAARPRRYRHVRLNIELKSVPARPDLFPTPDRFATLLLNTLRRYRSIDIVARTTVQSFDHRTLAALRRRAPKITLAVLTGKSTQHYVRLLRELDAQIISPNHLWITKTDVAAVHRAGGRVIPWTANHPRQWKRLADAGVDGIITDYPGRLIQFLKKNGRR